MVTLGSSNDRSVNYTFSFFWGVLERVASGLEYVSDKVRALLVTDSVFGPPYYSFVEHRLR